MNQDISPKLKVATKQMEAICREHDIMGVFVLADGEDHSEFRIGLEIPTWSMIRFPPKGGVHVKGYGKSKPYETNKTINALWGIVDTLGRSFLNVSQIQKTLEKHLKIESEPGRWYGPDEEPIK